MKTEIKIKYSLSILLIIVGINKFIHFLPPMNLSQEAAAFMRILSESGYLLPIVGLIEISCGILLLKSNTTPIALLFLAPISVNILLFHIFLDPKNIWMALFVSASNLYLLYKNNDFYSPILFAVTNGKGVTREKLRASNLSYS